jgi:hypothetical protein
MPHGPSQPPTASGQQAGEPDADLTEVRRREILLLQPHTRTDARAVLALLHPDFVEFGAFGGVWDITTVTASLNPARIDATQLHATRLAPDVALVTYLSHHASRPDCRRSSLWIRHDDRGWLMRFHQGTPTSVTPDTTSQ